MIKLFGRWFAAVVMVAASLPGASLAYTDMVVLGDSLSDVGNLYLASPPIVGTPLPQDPPYYQGRFSDGANYVETLWAELGLSGTLAPSFAGGSDYAVGGSRTRYHAFDNAIPGFNPLTTPTAFADFTLLGQRDLLLANTGGNLNSSTLYTVWIGSNDVADALTAALLGAPAPVVDAMIAQSANDLLAVVGDMVTAGAQDFLIPTVPDIALTPEVQAFGAGAEALASLLSQAFNDLVDLGLTGISADIVRLDTFSFLRDLVTDPTEFGLPSTINVSDPCFTGFVGVPGLVCPNPDEYVYFDKIHPSAVTHAVLGKLAANAVPAPAVVLLIAAGLLGMRLQKPNRG